MGTLNINTVHHNIKWHTVNHWLKATVDKSCLQCSCILTLYRNNVSTLFSLNLPFPHFLKCILFLRSTNFLILCLTSLMYFCVSSGVSTAPGTTFTCTCLFPSCCVPPASLWRITLCTLVLGCRNLMLCLWITSLMLWMWHQWTLHSMWVKRYLILDVFHQIFIKYLMWQHFRLWHQYLY